MVHLTDEAEYNINTPGFPFEFSPRNSDCLYEFIAQQGYRVEVILDVDTTSCCDFLEVDICFLLFFLYFFFFNI